MKKIIFICITFFFLTGCFGSRSQVPDFFLLKSVVNNEELSAKKMTIAVEPVLVPDFLDRPQIVLQEAQGTQVTFSEMKRWAEPLSAVFQRVLIADLENYLPNAYIKTKQYTEETYNYTILVEINQMIGSLGEKAVLDVWWSVINTSGRLVMRDRASFKQKIGTAYEDYINAQSDMISSLAHQIAERIAGK